MFVVPVAAPTVTDGWPEDFLVMMLMTPERASEPYWAEAAPRTISMRSMVWTFSRSRANRFCVVDVSSMAVRWPFIRIRALLLAMPRMEMR